MPIENLPLFVYGSLRSGFQHPAYAYISRYFSLMGTATVRGELYDMGEYPAAIPSGEEKLITGELYAIQKAEEFSWAIGQLDDYEGINGEPDEPQLYRRDKTTVFLNGQPIEAWIYWFNGSVKGKPKIDGGDLLLYIQQQKKL
eukprot:TRINITY_DN4966_c0_g1_i1.p1 TRINITY_DN4966_c0_g1~~TRINITY_DN4966_c0_g1_i1.p1  ORF type:complete len:159 (-),score=4.44 TRINITY_DN4966_c0_g1_i1:90-518(-)